MRFTIDVDGKGEHHVEFSRDWFTGRAVVRIDGKPQTLAGLMDFSTHFTLQLVRKWRFLVAQHEVVIEKFRPVFFAGLRPQIYRVFVDGTLIDEHHGY